MKPIQKFINFFVRKKWLGILLLLGLAVGIAFPTIYRGVILKTKRTDLTVYLKAGETVLEDRAIQMYGVTNIRHWHYIYPPLLAILLAPVSKWPPVATIPLAYLLSIASLVGTVTLSRRFPENARPKPWQIVLAMLFCLPMFLNTLTRGQFDIITLFFMAAVFYNYLKGRKFLTGILLAFAVTLKVTPLAFLVFFFLMKREWKILLSTTAGFGLFFFLIPSAVIGFDTNLMLLKTWWGLMSISQSATAYQHYLWGELYTPFGPHHQSIYAVVTRLVWHSEAHFIRHYNSLIRWIPSGVGIALLILLCVRTRRASDTPAQDPLRLLVEFSLFPMLMLFTSPVNHIHHYTVIYFLFLAALMLMDRTSSESPSHRCLLLSLWICAFSLFLGTWFRSLGYWGIPLWGSMLLWSMVLLCPDQKSNPDL